MQLRDNFWMAQALREARKGLYSTPPNPAVGCVIVYDDQQVASGWHEYTGGPHAEVNAIQSADIPAGATFYVTLEPCSHHGRTPPCVDAVLAAQAARVVVAMQDPNPEVAGRGLQLLKEQGVEVESGLLETQARELNRGFVKRMEQQRPFVSVKMASSLDGRTALANGTSQWITGEAARKDVQLMRARSSAILTSAQTIIDDDPSLNLRLTREYLGQHCEIRHPVRIVVDSALKLSGKEKIFSTDGEIRIYTLSNDAQKRASLSAAGAIVVDAQADETGQVNLERLMQTLAQDGINEVHTECGQRLAGALVSQSLVDQIELYLAPRLLGSAARGSFDLGQLTSMKQGINGKINDIRQVGDDLRITLDLTSGVE